MNPQRCGFCWDLNPKTERVMDKDIPGSFLAVDGSEVGRGNRIPLWLLGFLY